MPIKQVQYTDTDVHGWVHRIVRSMGAEAWRPDYIVGITRGGLVPAVLLSQYLDVPMETIKVSFRDGEQCESNCWMAEDAFGHMHYDAMTSDDGRKNILIVDDINDTGRTLEWIRQDWMSSCLPNDERWTTEIWGYNVRVAVMINNGASEFKHVDYVGKEINKLETPEWCVFPWENWWE